MNKFKLVLYAFALLGAFFVACNRDDIVTVKGTPVTFAGRITDETGEAIVGAVVQSGSEQAISDQNGVFRLNPVLVDPQNAILYVQKLGYFDFSRAYIVRKNSLQTLEIQLLKKNQVGSVNASSGGTVNVPGGATLVFPANSVAKKSGGAYSGTVKIVAQYLDPEDPALPLKMPGDLRATNAAGVAGVLATFGMIGVELEDASGEPLQVAAGSSVEIRMPIPAGKASVAPATISLWHYDHETARWIEEGSAQKIGNEYVGTVQHFSFWNCDYFGETVNLEGRVLKQNSQAPLAGVWVRLTVLSTGFQGWATTDDNGYFGGLVPKNEAMKLEVYFNTDCGTQIFYTQDVGPYTTDTVLPDILISLATADAVNMSGRLVDCSNQPISNGYAKVSWGPLTRVAFTDGNGDFTFNFIDCLGTPTSGSIIAYDLDNFLESTAQTFTTPPLTVTFGDIAVCNALTEFIQYTLDGQQYTHIDGAASLWPQDSMPVTQYLTQIVSADSMQQFIQFSFINNNQPGSFALTNFFVAPFELDMSVNPNLTTTVTTAAANVGDPIIGTFGTNFVDLQGNPHTISGSYRVNRTY
jgi:hypothetical protein